MKFSPVKLEANLVGLDIGTSGLRMVQVKHSGSEARLITYGSVALDSNVLQSDAEGDRQQVIAAVRRLLESAQVSTKEVVAGIPTSKVFASLITVPKMSESELGKAIAYQAEQHVPMALDQVKLDWMLVGETADGKQQEVLLVAAPNALTERYLAMLEAAGLDVIAIEPDALAVNRALINPQDGIVMAVDVGATSSDIVASDRGLPKLMRSVPVGGASFVKAAAHNLNLEPAQAEQFVYKFGVAEGKMEGQVKKAIKTSVDSLVSEVDKSIKYFLTRYKDAKFNKVVLTGKASTVPDLPVYLANGINLPVEIGNPWTKISAPSEQQAQLMQLSNELTVACGLASRGGSK